MTNKTGYAFKDKPGEALKDFYVLIHSRGIERYPLFWKEFAIQLHKDIEAKFEKLEAVARAAKDHADATIQYKLGKISEADMAGHYNILVKKLAELERSDE